MSASSSAPTLSGLTFAGLPLSVGIRASAEEVGTGATRRELLRLADRLEGGTAGLQGASRGDRRSPLMTLVEAATASGRLPEVLDAYIHTARETRELRRMYLVALLYPVLILLIAAGLVSIILVTSSDYMQNLFNDFGIELPAVTVFVLSLADFLRFAGAWLWGGVLILAIVVLLSQMLPTFPGRGLLSRVFHFVPFVGSSWRNAAAAEFSWRLAVLVDAGIPLSEALALMSRSLGSYSLRKASRELSRQLEAGAVPRDFAHGVRGMMPQLAAVFRWADEGPMFAEGLRAQAELFSAQSRLRANQFAFLAAPLTCIGLGVLAATVVAAYFLPLVTLMNALT